MNVERTFLLIKKIKKYFLFMFLYKISINFFGGLMKVSKLEQGKKEENYSKK